VAALSTARRFVQRFTSSAGTFALRPVVKSSCNPLWRKLLITNQTVSSDETNCQMA
jgi:hypothetical protein